jgi:parallel beta-helix repeat protein
MGFSGASYATISGFELAGETNAPAVLVQQSSSHITVTLNTVLNAPAGGISVSGAGAGNVISHNTVENCTGVGITIYPTTATAASPTQVYDNLVTGSSGDGILIESNYVTVTSNEVTGNGQASGGSSGIHIYTPSASAGIGQHNTVSGNIAIGNIDSLDQDGNGIEIDQWATENTVTENLTTQNDGGGVVLYDAPGNTITYNIMFANGEDRHGTHAIHSELILNSSLGLTENNVIKNNSMVGYFTSVDAGFVSAASASGGNTFSANTLAVAGSWSVFQVGSTTGTQQSVWNSLLSASDIFAPPPLTAPTGGPYSYTFPAGTSAVVDGETITLYGWSASPGLYGTN